MRRALGMPSYGTHATLGTLIGQNHQKWGFWHLHIHQNVGLRIVGDSIAYGQVSVSARPQGVRRVGGAE